MEAYAEEVRKKKIMFHFYANTAALCMLFQVLDALLVSMDISTFKFLTFLAKNTWEIIIATLTLQSWVKQRGT
jgi:hypothetical protein